MCFILRQKAKPVNNTSLNSELIVLPSVFIDRFTKVALLEMY